MRHAVFVVLHVDYTAKYGIQRADTWLKSLIQMYLMTSHYHI